MDPSETRIETAAEQTAATVAETIATAENVVKDVADDVANAVETTTEAVAATAEDAAETVADVADEAADTIADAAVVTETAVPTTDPLGEDSACCPLAPCLIGAAGVVVLVVVVAAIARCKKGCKATSDKPRKSKGDGAMVEIYVGNLSYDMNDAQLRREFERYGVVKSARIITNRSNNKSKGYGFVEMPHRKEALIAIKALDNAEVMTRRIRVNEARANTKPPEDR